MTNDFRARMRHAARMLMSDNGQKISTAIHDALKNIPHPVNSAVPPRPMPGLVRDHYLKTLDRMNSADGLPDFVGDLLARLGTSPQCGNGRSLQDTLTPEPWTQPIAEPESAARITGQFLKKSFINHAGARDYKIFIPSTYVGQAMPLMVMLHGCTQNPDDFARGTRMNALAEERQCFVVYPAQTQSANASKCWNWFNAVDQQRDQGEPSIIAGITRQVISEYGLDANQVYIAGLSSGGAMAIIMGTTYPDVYAAVGVHSGLPYGAAQDLPSAFSAMRDATTIGRSANTFASNTNAQLGAIPIIVFHGDQDKTVNIKNSDQLVQQHFSTARANASGPKNRCDSSVIVQEGKVPNGHAYTCTSHHDESGRTIAEHWVIHGAGHAWAGGSKSGSYTDVKGPDASGEMMRFFFTQAKAS